MVPLLFSPSHSSFVLVLRGKRREKPPGNLLPLLLTVEIGLLPAGRALVDCSPEFKDAQDGFLYWGCSSLCPGPFLFPSEDVGMKETTFLRWC